MQKNSGQVVVYLRYSPRPLKSVDDERDPNAKQLEFCKEWCVKHGTTIKGDPFKDEMKSGGADYDDRPGLWGAIRALKTGDTLLAYKWDRLARSAYLSYIIERDVRQRGAKIATVVEECAGGCDPESKMVRQILQVFAEFQREVAAARTKGAMLRHQRNGRRMSARLPYGWQHDAADPKHMLPDEAERKTIARMRELHERGMSPRQIARALNKEGILARGLKPWHHATVTGIVQREVR